MFIRLKKRAPQNKGLMAASCDFSICKTNILINKNDSHLVSVYLRRVADKYNIYEFHNN